MGVNNRSTGRGWTLWAASVLVACLVTVLPLTVQAQQPKWRATVGAYYFDGWSGHTDHITKLLETKYADRKPLWGWKANTVEIMQKQIDYCADHGIAFWAFDWYYPEGEEATPLNNALGLYLKAPNRQHLKFCLLVANHAGFRIGPRDWDTCCQRWIELFRQPTHLLLDGQPLLIFFSPEELQQAFGGVDGVRQAFETLRAKAKQAGLPGVTVAACTGPEGNLDDLARSGYTLLTGYNYNLGWMTGGGSQPFQKLIDGSQRIFDQFAEKTPLPYVPVITAGWDRRPWEEKQLPAEKMSTWYPDRTPKLVEEFVRRGVQWLDKHHEKTTRERLLLIYAWNENGEGGYLTPTANDGTEYLKAVQRAITVDESATLPPAKMPQSFAVYPIGSVQKVDGRTMIVLDKKYEKGLLGLEHWSHMQVIWWFDRNDTPQKRAILQVHPRGNPKNPLTGVFACRAPVRPNLIALSLCKVVSVKDNVVEIDKIDAIEGTPVLDLKPYTPGNDRAMKVKVPDWTKTKGSQKGRNDQ